MAKASAIIDIAMATTTKGHLLMTGCL